MHWKITNFIQDCFTNKAKRRRSIALLSVLSVLVIGGVALQLMQPAITMSSELVCTIEEHTHSESCYTTQLSCELEETEEHAHSEACYTSVMVCTLEEHTHGGGCYAKKVEETIAPTATPAPTAEPTEVPTAVPTEAPTAVPTEVPTEEPTAVPAEDPTEAPAEDPTEAPAEEPTEVPSDVTTEAPTEEPTEVPAATEEVPVTEEPVETEEPEVTEEPIALTFSITSEKELGVLVGEKASWSFASTGVLSLNYTVKNADGDVVVPATELDPAATKLEWSTEDAGIYTITITASNGENVISQNAILAVSDGTLMVTLNTDVLYASVDNSPIFRISHSGGVAPVTYQVSVLQGETEILSLTDYEQNSFTVNVESREEASTLTVNVKAVDADGNAAEAFAELRCSGVMTETEAEWKSTFDHVQLTGVWPEDLVAIASTQLGYTESTENFVITEEGFFGYTRYGDWWHLPYSDWCAMFTSFCMEYAELPENALPQESNATRMMKQYRASALYATANSDYLPKAGDLIFFDWDQDKIVDHVGIVFSANESQIVTIEGNHDAEVAKHTYSLGDPTIAGYGLINLAYETMLAETATEAPETEPTPAPEGEASYYICEKSEHAHEDACYDAESNLICEAEEHVHTDECLVAPEVTEEPVAPETEYFCGVEEHAHDEACFDAEGTLICEIAEHAHTDECLVAPEVTEEPTVTPEPEYFCGVEEHAHDEACFDAEGILICEIAEHAHTDECLVAPEVTEEPTVTPESEYFCGVEEHAHDEACFDAEGTLICEIAEHAHTELCLVAPEVTEEPTVTPEPEYFCGVEEHAHDEACFDAEGTLICEIAEHAHTDECLVMPVFYCGMEEHVHTAECLDEDMNIVCGKPDHAHVELCSEPQPTHYEYQDEYVFITVDVPEGVTIPFGAELVIVPIEQGSEEYNSTVDQAKQVTGKKSVEDLVYDISFKLNGMEVEPIGGSVNIRFQLSENVLNSTDMLPEEFEVNVVHMVDENTPELLENEAVVDEDGTVHSVDFSSDSFSTYYVAVNLAGDIDPGTYRGKTFNYNDVRNAFVNDPTYSKYIVHTSPLGIAGSFHIVAFDTVNIKSHTNGNILALNANVGSNFGTNQLADELSYIVNYNQIHSGSAAKPNHLLVVGSSHTISLVDNGTAMAIDDKKIDRPNTIIKDRDSNNRPFIDLDYVQNQIKGISQNLYNVTSDDDEVPWEKIYEYNWWSPTPKEKDTGTKSFGADTAVIQSGGWYTSPNGGYYLNPTINISNLDGAAYVQMTPKTLSGISRTLEFRGFKSGHDGSLIINVDCSGMSGQKIKMPSTMLYIDDKQTAASETGEFSNGKIIWNFVHADGVTIETDTMVGSIIAPGATVNIKSNLNGTVIADTINVLAESHRTDFTGTTKPTSVSSSFKKYVDGSSPKATENFVFYKEKWNGSSWEYVDEAINYGTEFHFADTTFTSNDVGKTYWYRVYEAPIEQQTALGDSNYITSTQQYVMKVKVEKKIVKVGHGFYAYTYEEIAVKTTYFRFDTNGAPDVSGPEPKLNNKPGKKVGAKDLTFNNITVPKTTPTPTPGLEPTPSPTETPEATPTPAPSPQPTSTQFSFFKTVNGNPAAGDQIFRFELESLDINEQTGEVTATHIAEKTNENPDQAGYAIDKFTFYNVPIPHNTELDAEQGSDTYSQWFRVYEYQYADDATMTDTYDLSKNQYIIRVVVNDDYQVGAQVESVEYYRITKTNPDGSLVNVSFIGEYDADDVLIEYTLDPTIATRVGNTSELSFNNNEKNRNPNPTTIGVDLHKQVGGAAVTLGADNTFPAFTFVMEELTHTEDAQGIVTSQWTEFAKLNNIPDLNKMVTVDNGDGTYSNRQAADLIHTDMSYNFQTDIGVHWYRIYETEATPKVHTYENGAVTPSDTEYSYGQKNLINSTEQYFVRVEVTMDADYNLHTEASYYSYTNPQRENGKPVSPTFVANNTEVNTAELVQLNDPANQMTFHNELTDVKASAVVDPALFLKHFDGDHVYEKYNQSFTFIMEELVNDKWTTIQTVKNTDSSTEYGGGTYDFVKFSDLTYDAPGEHWYRIRESQQGIGGVVLDQTEYVMYVNIGAPTTEHPDGWYVDETTGENKYTVDQVTYQVNNEAVYGTGSDDPGTDDPGTDTPEPTTPPSSGGSYGTSVTWSGSIDKYNNLGDIEWKLYVEVGDKRIADNLYSDTTNSGLGKEADKVQAFMNGQVFSQVGLQTYGGSVLEFYSISYSNEKRDVSVTFNYTGTYDFSVTSAWLASPNIQNYTIPLTPNSNSGTTTASTNYEPEVVAENPTIPVAPSTLPLVIPKADGTGYTVNMEALVGYDGTNADDIQPATPVEYPKAVFNNTTISYNDTAETTLTFNKRIQESGSSENYKPVDKVFEFELYELDSETNEWVRIQQKQNATTTDTTASITFDPIQYTKEGSYWYKVIETQTNMTGYILDTHAYYVNVNVERNGDQLVANKDYYIVTDGATGVGTITVTTTTTVATNIKKTYTEINNGQQAYIRFPVAPESTSCGLRIIFKDCQNVNASELYFNVNLAGCWYNGKKGDIPSSLVSDLTIGSFNGFQTPNSTTVYPIHLTVQNLGGTGSITLERIEYQTTPGGSWQQAILSNTADGAASGSTESTTTTTTYTSIFDENGQPIKDALAATVDGNNQTFVNKEVEVIYNPVDASLKMLKHVDNKLYTGHAGDFTFKLEKLEITGDTAKWVDTGKTTTNDANGNVIFSGANDGLQFSKDDVGKTYWYRVTEQTGNGNYIYSGEAYIFKVEVLRSGGQLIANTTTYNQTGSQMNLTSGALLGEYEVGTKRTASFTAPESSTGNWNLNFVSTGSVDANFKVYLDDKPLSVNTSDWYASHSGGGGYFATNLSKGRHTITLELVSFNTSSGPYVISGSNVVYAIGSETLTAKLTPVYASNANDGSSVITGNTVDESVLTRTEVGGNVFHNTTKTDTPDKTEITLKFKKMMGDNLYSGTEKFNFILYAVNKNGYVATSTTVAQEKNVAQNINIGPLKYSTKEDDSNLGGYDTYYYKAVEQQSYPGTNLDARYEFGNDEYLVVVKVTSSDGNMVANAYYYKWPGDGFDPLNLGDPIYTNSSAIGDDGMTTSSGTVPTFNNKSRQNAELPKTGGAGTILYTAGGLLLMAASLLYWCATRRKRERRYE